MCPLPQTLQFLVVAVAGWINQQQRDVIDYLQEENRVLREQFAPRRLRFTDAQRRRLAAKAKTLGRRAPAEMETLVTPAHTRRLRSSSIGETAAYFTTTVASRSTFRCTRAVDQRTARRWDFYFDQSPNRR